MTVEIPVKKIQPKRKSHLMWACVWQALARDVKSSHDLRDWAQKW